MLRPAEHALDHHVGEEPETILVFGTRRHTAQDHAPHKLLVQALARVIGEHQTSIAEPVALGALVWRVARDSRRDRVEVLPLLPREVKVGEDDTVLEKGDAGHAKRHMQTPLKKLTRHVGDWVLKRGALGAHVDEHFAQVLWIAEE